MDLAEMPLTEQGNRYVIDYLTKWVEATPLPDQRPLFLKRKNKPRLISEAGFY